MEFWSPLTRAITIGLMGTFLLGDHALSFFGKSRKIRRNRAKCDGALSSGVGFASPWVATAFIAANASERELIGNKRRSGVARIALSGSVSGSVLPREPP